MTRPKIFTREEYRKNQLQSGKKYVAKKYKIIEEYKRTLQCKRCGFDFRRHPCVCDFHHTDKKNFPISFEVQNKSIKKIMDEIKLCEPLCANCHRIIEWEKKQAKIQKEYRRKTDAFFKR